MIGDEQTLVHFGHIDDQVGNRLDCAVAPREKVHLEVFDIASDTPITLENLVRQITEYGGAPTPGCKIPVGPVRAVGQFCEILWSPFDPRPPLSRRRIGYFTHNRAFDPTKAREQLGYVSRRSHPDGIAQTIDWYRAQGLVPQATATGVDFRRAGRAG